MNRQSKRCSRIGAVVARSVADDDPALVGWRTDSERAERQRVERSRHGAVGSAAALARAAVPHGVGDRYAVPLDDLHAFDEIGVGHELADHLRHDEPWRDVGTELLDEERQPGRRTGEGRWGDVRGVRVAQVGQDAADLAMEGVVRHQPCSFMESSQLLHRVDAVHRPLQRKVHVQPVEQVGEHRDDVGALGLGQRIARRRGGHRLGPTQPEECTVHGSTADSAKS